MQNAKTKRESIGVELYGYQQSLAKLQLQLEQTHQNHQIINKIRLQVSDNSITIVGIKDTCCMCSPVSTATLLQPVRKFTGVRG